MNQFDLGKTRDGVFIIAQPVLVPKVHVSIEAGKAKTTVKLSKPDQSVVGRPLKRLGLVWCTRVLCSFFCFIWWSAYFHAPQVQARRERRFREVEADPVHHLHRHVDQGGQDPFVIVYMLHFYDPLCRARFLIISI